MNQMMSWLAMMTENLYILTLTSHHDEQHHDHSAQRSQHIIHLKHEAPRIKPRWEFLQKHKDMLSSTGPMSTRHFSHKVRDTQTLFPSTCFESGGDTHAYAKSLFASVWSHFNKECCWDWWLRGYSRDKTLVTQAWGLQFRSSALPWMLGGRACLLSQYIGGKDGEPLISLARLAKSASSESEGKSLLQYIRYRTIT